MAGTTQPDVIDLLGRGIRGALTDLAIVVVDACPPPTLPAVLVSVGGTPEATAGGHQEWAYLGARTKREEYEVQIVVSAAIGGDGFQGWSTEADQQKVVRDMAYAAGHAIEAFLIADPSLGQFFNTGDRRGGWCGVGPMVLQQTDRSVVAAGVYAEIHMSVAVVALIG